MDLAGHETTTTATVNIDLTPPTVTLTAPANLTTTTATSITLAGEASDALSGLSTVTCDGAAATVTNGQVTCEVPLRPGINDLVLAARDVAGNARSVGVRVRRTGASTVLALAPAMQTVLIDEAVSLTLSDDFGATIGGADWESSDPALVSVSADDPPVLTALAAGTVTITAARGSLSAQATLVVEAGPLAAGTARWALNGVFGDIVSALPANRVDLSVPDMFTVEPGGTGTVVRGITARGDAQWVVQAPAPPLMADSFGGLVGGVDPQPLASAYIPWDNTEYPYPRFRGFARFAGPVAAPPWRYDSPGSVQTPAQAPDGTIYAIEKYETGLTDSHGLPIIETQVVVLDGSTGAARAKIALSREIYNHSHGCGADGHVVVPLARGPVVGLDGHGYVLVRAAVSGRPGPCGSTTVSQDVGLTLLRISPTGSASATTIYAQHCERGPWDLSVCDKPPLLTDLMPDGLDGVLVRAGYTTAAYRDAQGVATYPREGRVTRVTAEGVQYDLAADFADLWLTGGRGPRLCRRCLRRAGGERGRLDHGVVRAQPVAASGHGARRRWGGDVR